MIGKAACIFDNGGPDQKILVPKSREGVVSRSNL